MQFSSNGKCPWQRCRCNDRLVNGTLMSSSSSPGPLGSSGGGSPFGVFGFLWNPDAGSSPKGSSSNRPSGSSGFLFRGSMFGEGSESNTKGSVPVPLPGEGSPRTARRLCVNFSAVPGGLGSSSPTTMPHMPTMSHMPKQDNMPT